MTFPSAACQTCKIRRIKCDETKPICQRCTKSRRICLETSAAQQACFAIHVENRYASGKTKRPRGPRSSLTMLRPHFDLQTRALAYYLKYHLQVLTGVPYVVGDLSECVSAWNLSGRTCSMVELALSSISLAIFSRTQHHPPAATEASSRYYCLLRIARHRIAQVGSPTSDVPNIDACLLAIFLMGRFEGATHRPGEINSKDSLTSLHSWSHHDGAMALLKIWNENLSHNTAMGIIKHIRRWLIRSFLVRSLPLPDWILSGNRFGERDDALDYDGIIVRMVNLRHACASLQQKNGLQNAKAEELNNEAKELDKALQDWATRIFITCSYQCHILGEPGPWPRRHFYSSVIYCYAIPGYAAVSCQYLADRMLICGTRLRVLELSSPKPLVEFTIEQQRRECITQLQLMADSLASTIPFCLERFKVETLNSHYSITLNITEEIKPYLANFVVWPLMVASTVRGIDVKQQRWFRSELARLGRTIGDGVLEFAETDQWDIFEAGVLGRGNAELKSGGRKKRVG